jgi:hypothetical protein
VSLAVDDTFLVENYSPGTSPASLEAAGRRVCAEVEALARAGRRMRMLRTAVVPRDETLLCLIDAASEELVREAFCRAGVSFDRISSALSREAT